MGDVPPGDGEDGPGLLAVAAWLALFAGLAWAIHAALWFFPEGWRWVNDDRARTAWTARAAISLALALPTSLWVLGTWFALTGRREPPVTRAARRAVAPAARAGGRDEGAPAREAGCGTLLLALAAATLALRPAAFALLPLAGIDPERAGATAFVLWLALCAIAVVVASAAARAVGR